jgi:uncharacterized membrane protein
MSFALILKFLHILAALWLVSGLLGRGITLRQASRTQDIHTTTALLQLGGFFERRMAIPGSMAVFVLGLFTAWVQGWPMLGFLQGSSINWVLASILLYLSLFPLISLVFIPRGKLFEAALQEAQAQGQVTPRLTAAFNDRVVAAGHIYELAAVAVIVYLMVVKPF